MHFHEYRLKEDWLGSDSLSTEATMNLKALAQLERDTQGTQTDRKQARPSNRNQHALWCAWYLDRE